MSRGTCQYIESGQAEWLALDARDAYSKATSLSLQTVSPYDGPKELEAIDSRLKEAALWLKFCHIVEFRLCMYDLGLIL